MASEARKCVLVRFRAKLSLNGVHAYGAPWMDEFEVQMSEGRMKSQKWKPKFLIWEVSNFEGFHS